MVPSAVSAHRPPRSFSADDRATGGRPRSFRPAGADKVPRRGTGRAVPGVTSTTAIDPPSIALDRPLLTAEEVAALLAVPQSSVYEYARRRNDPLPSVLIGRHRRFDRRTVERWLAAQLTPGVTR